MPDGNTERARPTMHDVAAAAGVSRALVSIIFRGAPGASASTRDRVFATAAELGYRPNRAASLLKSARSRHLGVTMRIRSAFHAELVEAIQAHADRAKYEIVLSSVTETHDEQRAIETLLDFRCEALILIGSDLPTEDLRRLGVTVPVVLVGRQADGSEVDVVRTSETLGQRLIVDHLHTLGHRRIVHVDGGQHPIADARRDSFVQAANHHGLAGPLSVEGGALERHGRRAVAELLRGARLPTAITAFNDDCALGVLDALRSAGVRVPEDVSVVGYDDSPFTGFAAIDLTTVSQEAGLQAEGAIRSAVDKLDRGRAQPTETVLEPRLVVRGTTAPPPST